MISQPEGTHDLYLLFFLLLSLGHHAYLFQEPHCIQVGAIGFWTHTLYEILSSLGLYRYNKYPFSNHASQISEKHYSQPTSISRQPGVESDSRAQKSSTSRPNGGKNVYLLASLAALVVGTDSIPGYPIATTGRNLSKILLRVRAVLAKQNFFPCRRVSDVRIVA